MVNASGGFIQQLYLHESFSTVPLNSTSTSTVSVENDTLSACSNTISTSPKYAMDLGHLRRPGQWKITVTPSDLIG